jgi:hippurate hydrolase
MKAARLLVLAFGLGIAATAARADLAEDIARDYAYLEDLYRHFHTHPELSLKEAQSAARIAAELESLGFAVTRGIGGHGVVAVMERGGGPTVMLRGDMDALPVEEQTGLPYASRVVAEDHLGNTVPVMHACGHDVHMTALVGVARRLAAMKDRWRGTLLLIAQPAEELGMGAKAMLEDGLFERFPRPDYALALHTAADLPAGHIGYAPGWAYANVDSVDILVKGRGGHGSRPESTKDPVVLAAYIVTALQTLVSREVPPGAPAVVTVGSIHGGTKHNIIPDEVRLQLTVRSFTDEVRAQLLEGIERIAVGQARSAGLPEELWPKVTLSDEFTPSGYNDPGLTERIVKVFESRFGAARVHRREPVMGGEDFGRYGREEPRIPSLLFWMGSVAAERVEAAARGGEPLPSLHSSRFAPLPEPTLKTGVEAMTAAALELLAKP